MPNGRLLRTRLNVAETVSPRVPLSDASVYGTDTGFLGHAEPGNQVSVNAAFEYSLTRNWVLALDLMYNHGNATNLRGSEATQAIVRNSGSSDAFGFAPALEYNLTANLGVLAGVRVFPAGHNASSSVTPALAVNYVL
jgi:hypothetical protein